MPEVDLSKKIGPLPLGAWGVVVGGGIFLGLKMRNSGLTTMADYSTDGGDASSTDGNGDYSVPSGAYFNPALNQTGLDNTGNPAAPAEDNAITDNDQWGYEAIKALILKGYDPIRADIAVRNYLANETLDPSMGSIINDAIREVGPTPFGLPPGTIPTPTTPTAGTSSSAGTGSNRPVATPKPKPISHPKPKAKPKYTHYTVKPGNTLSGIAKKYHTSYQKIFAANKKGTVRLDGTKGILTNPNLIRPGQRLVIPT